MINYTEYSINIWVYNLVPIVIPLNLHKIMQVHVQANYMLIDTN